MRWGSISGEEGEMQFKSYYHLGCLKLPRAGLELSDIEGMDKLDANTAKEAKAAYADAVERAAKPKTPAKRKAPATKSESKKSKKSHPDLKIEKKEQGKRDETGALVDEDPILLKYSKMKISELKDFLKMNHMLRTGVKQELVDRCVDGEKHGRFPPCPQCGKGQLRLTERKMVACGGYFDDSINMRLPCTFEAAAGDIKREKWLIPGVDEEIDTATDGVDSSNRESTEEELAKVDKAFSSLQEGSSARDYGLKLVEVARNMGLKIPEDEKAALQRAGSALMATRDENGKFDASRAFQHLQQDVGTIEEANAKAEKKQEPTAQVDANTKIAQILDELGTLEAKFQDSPNYAFTVRALKKAAIAIRGVDFKITSGKQVSQGKQKIAGVGKGTAKAIDEILTTGSSARLEELRTREAEQG
eukprot:CAMPEP_0184510560 /NCGR_PEP_ID=MMETSP0198_2-20121128/1879_1 /TAXON_ID=1112570 /ORGANISM="Thraustochytrium sp., Strain LLF1b" /LENGTH=417 /DNA_ID=CAMNT_0026900459 /DNA_START=363 /DNA_END=1616 /DNA_ORIENTATION=-